MDLSINRKNRVLRLRGLNPLLDGFCNFSRMTEENIADLSGVGGPTATTYKK
jgi:hypothetical protein